MRVALRMAIVCLVRRIDHLPRDSVVSDSTCAGAWLEVQAQGHTLMSDSERRSSMDSDCNAVGSGSPSPIEQ